MGSTISAGWRGSARSIATNRSSMRHGSGWPSRWPPRSASRATPTSSVTRSNDSTQRSTSPPATTDAGSPRPRYGSSSGACSTATRSTLAAVRRRLGRSRRRAWGHRSSRPTADPSARSTARRGSPSGRRCEHATSTRSATRVCPRYVRGHRGTITIRQPAFVFPDSNAHGRGEDPQWVYAVEFTAVELWGAGDHVVTVDLFEPYLEAA